MKKGKIMCYEETETLIDMFKVAIALVLIIGIVGGIGYGIALREQTKEALDAISELTSSSYIGDIEREALVKASEKEGWTVASTGAMLGTWVASIIIAILLYAKRCQIEMMDIMLSKLSTIIDKQTKQKEAK